MNNQITLKQARMNVGYEIQEAAKKLGVSTRTLLRWETDSGPMNLIEFHRAGQLYGIKGDHIFIGKAVDCPAAGNVLAKAIRKAATVEADQITISAETLLAELKILGVDVSEAERFLDSLDEKKDAPTTANGEGAAC
ncbi:helix-turn-helix domain-containing protein [Gorillibacterium timonense]|uniref:helix-turn-helix domain-containing protein n=1 Tax=Gorillibacterium timonense TaxID=1689269 RepID=UPI00071CB696|nr:helix-turn-helix domain-containing protein [Gorillibacterium timonense]